MAKKKLLADKLRTPRTNKKPIDLASVELVGVKKEEKRTDSVPKPVAPVAEAKPKKVVNKKTAAAKKIEAVEEQEMHRTSFNFPFDIYEAMRLHTFKNRTTMTDYIITLIKKDLKIK